MILPNSNSGNANTDMLFRIIDEKLSELYSIHGKQSPRDAIVLSKQVTASETPVDGGVYKNSIVRAWCRVDVSGTEASIIDEFNISRVVIQTTGTYLFYYKTRPGKNTLAGFASLITASAPRVFIVRPSFEDYFSVLSYNLAGALADCTQLSAGVIG